jgi:hypothetical protein
VVSLEPESCKPLSSGFTIEATSFKLDPRAKMLPRNGTKQYQAHQPNGPKRPPSAPAAPIFMEMSGEAAKRAIGACHGLDSKRRPD